jgi:hypothetical protein
MKHLIDAHRAAGHSFDAAGVTSFVRAAGAAGVVIPLPEGDR